MEFTAKQLAKVLRGTVDGDSEAKVTSFAKIEHGKAGQLCFFANTNTMSILARRVSFL